MSYYLVRFAKKGQRPSEMLEKIMVEAGGVSAAQEKADIAAKSGGGGKAVLQLFNEKGLVSSRTSEGRWSV